MRRKNHILDSFDAKVITELQKDGRQRNTEIARQLGVAEATVRSRIERLLGDKVMQIGAWADPLKVGYKHYALIEIQVNLADVEKVAERLARLPEIFFLGTCTGTWDILANAIFRSNEHMHDFLTRTLGRIRGIQRTSTSSFTRIVKREYAFPVLSVDADEGVRRVGRVGPIRSASTRRGSGSR